MGGASSPLPPAGRHCVPLLIVALETRTNIRDSTRAAPSHTQFCQLACLFAYGFIFRRDPPLRRQIQSPEICIASCDRNLPADDKSAAFHCLAHNAPHRRKL